DVGFVVRVATRPRIAGRRLVTTQRLLRPVVTRSRLVTRSVLEQLHKERAVADEGRTVIVGGRDSIPIVVIPVCGPVVLDELRLVDGNQVGALVEVVAAAGVATIGHDSVEQYLGVSSRALRRIDELALDVLPA